jgi:hypothetical protein
MKSILVIIVMNQGWCRGFRPDLHWYRHAPFVVIGLGYLVSAIFMAKSRKVDRAILHGVAWEKKSLLHLLSTTLFLYGLILIFSFPPVACLMWSGLIPASDWYGELVLQLAIAGIVTFMFRFFDCMERFFY